MRSNPWNHNNARWPEYDFGARKNMRKQSEGRIYHQCGGEYERKWKTEASGCPQKKKKATDVYRKDDHSHSSVHHPWPVCISWKRYAWKEKLRDNREQAATSAESESTADTAGTESAAETETQAQKKEDDIMSQAELKAAQYDYDGAIELLKASSDFADSQDMQD